MYGSEKVKQRRIALFQQSTEVLYNPLDIESYHTMYITKLNTSIHLGGSN